MWRVRERLRERVEEGDRGTHPDRGSVSVRQRHLCMRQTPVFAFLAFTSIMYTVALPHEKQSALPRLSKKDSGSPSPRELRPLNSWHAPLPGSTGLGLLHAGRDRRRRELLAASHAGSPGRGGLDISSSKGGTAMQQRRAVITTIWSFIATAAFAVAVVLPLKGYQATLDFTTGFLVEKSLSVDNLFVFLMIFDYFKVPDDYTERVLSWGILSALVLRGVMIGIGVAAVQRFRPVLLGFALILVVSAYKMLQPEEEEDLSNNAVMRLARRLVQATDEYDGDKFFTRVGGVRRATPMLVVLICIELSDVLFAVDSIPAVVGITQDPFIVYTSNIFALMALRSLYLILAKSVQSLLYLRHAVASILGFVGLKMAAEYFHIHISSAASLGFITLALVTGTLASLERNRRAANAPPARQAVHDVV